MGELLVESGAALFVFAAAFAALELLRGRDGAPAAHASVAAEVRHRGFEILDEFRPLVDVMLLYGRGAWGPSLRHARIMRTLWREPHGLYLFALCDDAWRPRLFRADRILGLQTLSGEALDLRPFLHERLGVAEARLGSARPAPLPAAPRPFGRAREMPQPPSLS